MLRLLPILVFLAIFAAARPAWAQAGKLQQVREDVRAPGSPVSSGGCEDTDKTKDCSSNDAGDWLSILFSGWASGDQEDCSDSEGGEGDGNGASVHPVLALIGAPWILPCLMTGDHYAHLGYFLDYPYADGFPGSMWINRTRPLEP